MPEDRSEVLGSPAAPASRAAGGGSSRRWLAWSLALAAIAGCLLFVDIDDMLARMRRMDAREIALVLGLITFDRVLMALKWRLLLNIAGAHLSPLTVIRIYYQGCLVGALLPSIAGDLLRAHLVAQRTGVVHPVLASILMERMIGFVSTLNWGILGAVVFISYLEPGYWPIWILLGLLAALAANGVFLLSLHRTIHEVTLGLLARYQQARLMGILHKLYLAYASFSNHPGVLLGNLALTLLEQLLQMLILFTIAATLGIMLQPFIFAAAAALQLLILRIPITPDGWGTGEVAAIAVFGLVGISAASAFSMSVISRFLGMAAVLPGFLFMALPRELLFWDNATRRPQQPQVNLQGHWSRLPMYLMGCVFFSLGVKLFIDAELGVDPLHAMTIGMVQVIDLPYLQIGFMDGCLTVALLILWGAWNRKLPPLSTFVTMVLTGILIDLWNWLDLAAVTEAMGSRALLMLAGLVLNAYGSALIIMSGIGIRVVDLVALTLVKRIGCRFYLAKLALEAAFLFWGFVFGGPIGLSTVAFLCVVGPFVEPFIWANQRLLNLPDYGLRRAMSRS